MRSGTASTGSAQRGVSSTPGVGAGERLLEAIEKRARGLRLKQLFVLTTRAEHWFVERGFKLVSVDDLPTKKRDMYNYQRRSKVLSKTL